MKEAADPCAPRRSVDHFSTNEPLPALQATARDSRLVPGCPITISPWPSFLFPPLPAFPTRHPPRQAGQDGERAGPEWQICELVTHSATMWCACRCACWMLGWAPTLITRICVVCRKSSSLTHRHLSFPYISTAAMPPSEVTALLAPSYLHAPLLEL